MLPNGINKIHNFLWTGEAFAPANVCIYTNKQDKILWKHIFRGAIRLQMGIYITKTSKLSNFEIQTLLPIAI